MPSPDLSKRSDPLGPLRDKRVIDVSTNDYENERGFICQVAAAGNLEYQTLDGDADATENGLAQGDVVNVAGIPVLLKAVRAAAGSDTTIGSIVAGIV